MKTIHIPTKITRLLILFLGLVITTASCKESTPKTGSSSNSELSYTSKMTKSDKKKYYNGETVVYEVKYKPDAFKLRTPSSKLLWKVKLYDTKIKVSDNEENLNPYEIKILGNNSAKLEKNGLVIARTSFNTEANTQDINFLESDKSISFSQSYSPILLVKAIDALADDQKEIIMLELADKGY